MGPGSGPSDSKKENTILALLVDVLAMPLHDGAQTSEAADASIDARRDQLPVVMHMWDEERG